MILDMAVIDCEQDTFIMLRFAGFSALLAAAVFLGLFLSGERNGGRTARETDASREFRRLAREIQELRRELNALRATVESRFSVHGIDIAGVPQDVRRGPAREEDAAPPARVREEEEAAMASANRFAELLQQRIPDVTREAALELHRLYSDWQRRRADLRQEQMREFKSHTSWREARDRMMRYAEEEHALNERFYSDALRNLRDPSQLGEFKELIRD